MIATYPEDYDQRLSEIFAGTFQHLRLLALDPYDIALCKIERNGERDRFDVLHLARKVPFDLALLRDRYVRELRPNLMNPKPCDLALDLWVEMIEEDRSRSTPRR